MIHARGRRGSPRRHEDPTAFVAWVLAGRPKRLDSLNRLVSLEPVQGAADARAAPARPVYELHQQSNRPSGVTHDSGWASDPWSPAPHDRLLSPDGDALSRVLRPRTGLWLPQMATQRCGTRRGTLGEWIHAWSGYSIFLTVPLGTLLGPPSARRCVFQATCVTLRSSPPSWVSQRRPRS